MKKLFSVLLSFAIVLGMGSVALAEAKPWSDEKDKSNLTLTKDYYVKGDNSEAPIKDQMTFTITPVEVLERSEPVEGEKELPPSFGPLTINYDNGKSTGSVPFPKYTNVGTYVYTIKENPPVKTNPTAGVDYNAPEMELKVTVIRDGENYVVYQYAIRVLEGEKPDQEPGEKTDVVKNTYEAGSLEIKKEVTGNFGDKEKEFTVNVIFTKDEDTNIGSVISYGPSESEKINLKDWDGNSTKIVPIKVKVGSPVTFNNIPKGVTWNVVEDEIHTEDEGYIASYEVNGEPVKTTFAEKQIIDSETDAVTITNTKDADVDTGISLDSIPYILILGLAVVGIGALFLRRRKNANF